MFPEFAEGTFIWHWAHSWAGLHGMILGLLSGFLAVFLTIRQYWLVARTMRAGDHGYVANGDPNLEQILKSIKDGGLTRIMTLPVQLCDLVAYKTRKPVYWGTHSDSFDLRLEALFPVLQHPLTHYADDGVNRLLLDTQYATAGELGLEEKTLIEVHGRYALYRLQA